MRLPTWVFGRGKVALRPHFVKKHNFLPESVSWGVRTRPAFIAPPEELPRGRGISAGASAPTRRGPTATMADLDPPYRPNPGYALGQVPFGIHRDRSPVHLVGGVIEKLIGVATVVAGIRRGES